MCSGWVQEPRAPQEKVYNKTHPLLFIHYPSFFFFLLAFAVVVFPESLSSESDSPIVKKRDRYKAHLSANLKSPLCVGFWLSRPLSIILNVSGWVMVYLWFTWNFIAFHLIWLSIASCHFSLRVTSGDLLFLPLLFLLMLSAIYIYIILCF